MSVAIGLLYAAAGGATYFVLQILNQRFTRRSHYGMAPPVNDPHQHCDRHPIKCTAGHLADKLTAQSQALHLIADCSRCPGCATTAQAAINYDPRDPIHAD